MKVQVASRQAAEMDRLAACAPQKRATRARLARDRTELFGQPRAFFSLANHERVVFAMR